MHLSSVLCPILGHVRYSATAQHMRCWVCGKPLANKSAMDREEQKFSLRHLAELLWESHNLVVEMQVSSRQENVR